MPIINKEKMSHWSKNVVEELPASYIGDLKKSLSPKSNSRTAIKIPKFSEIFNSYIRQDRD